MKTYLLSAIIFLQSLSGMAQNYDRIIIHVGDTLSHYYTYRFPSFQNATVLFRNGGSLAAKMNFNTLLCIMEFIDTKGDTLELSNTGDIDSIRLNNATFFFRDSYFEIIGAAGPVKLAVSRKASFEPVKIGAMGLPARNVAVDNYDTYNSGDKHMKLIQLQANQDIYVHEKTEFFLINNGELNKATKSNFLKIFNGDKKRVENYLKQNKPNFNNQADLEKLFNFCTHT